MKNLLLILIMTFTFVTMTSHAKEHSLAQPNLLQKAPANQLIQGNGCFRNCIIQRRVCISRALLNNTSTFVCEVAFENCLTVCFQN